MSWEPLQIIIAQCFKTWLGLVPYLAAGAIIFSLLSVRFACNRDGPWWKSSELVTDLCYWFIVPVFTRFLRVGLLVLGATYIFGIRGADEIVQFFDNGHGPWANLPFWAQTILYLVVSDLLLYWSHRIFHHMPMWKYHAVHHSSEHVDWTSAARFHPINLFLGSVMVDVILILAGIPPAVLGILIPFSLFMSMFVHANLNWSLGPLKYVIATPVFHRWHHTAADRGGSKNFASTFPILDVIFGTFYMPKNELPDAYGNGDPKFPASFGQQLVYPFKQ